MDLAQIEAFLILCEELHFGRTAERLYVSQPRVSRLIADLESDIGGVLFERTSRRVALTPLGVRLRDRLAPVYEQLTAALAEARTAARSPAGLLRLGFAATTAGPPAAGWSGLPACTPTAPRRCRRWHSPIHTVRSSRVRSTCWRAGLFSTIPALPSAPRSPGTRGHWPSPSITRSPASRACRSRYSPTTRCRTGTTTAWPTASGKRWGHRGPRSDAPSKCTV